MSSQRYEHLFDLIKEELSKTAKKRERLRNLDLFVLDNSLRESTVGQLRGHTLDNKWGILAEVKKCGFKHIIVSAFSHVPRVDDEFVKQLSERETDMSCYYAFSEVHGSKKSKIPVGLQKMMTYRIPNPIFEIDLVGCSSDEEIDRLHALLQERIDFTYENLSRDAKILVNFRDLAPAMIKHPLCVFDTTKFLGSMPANQRPFGIIFEEPTGKYLPEQLGGFTRSIRRLMDDCDWKSGHLLVHIHKKWEYAEVAQIECLGCGANGIWASVCEEGAALGHACSIITIMNLIRFGNKKVLEGYNCRELRQAAINVTKITTGNPPHPKQTVYGERALDVVLDTSSGMGAATGKEDIDSNICSAIVHELDLAKFYGCKAPVRISTLASPAMVQERLVDLFGKHDNFTIAIAEKMKALMIADLDENLKEEYMSSIGIALLFMRAGGTLHPDMIATIESAQQYSNIHQALIKEVKQIWDQWNITEDAEKDDTLGFHAFYNGFMSPYFGCYECEDSKKALQAIDLHRDGKIEWVGFRVFLEWALDEFPDIDSADDLLSAAFRKGIIPAMQCEIVKKNCCNGF